MVVDIVVLRFVFDGRSCRDFSFVVAMNLFEFYLTVLHLADQCRPLEYRMLFPHLFGYAAQLQALW